MPEANLTVRVPVPSRRPRSSGGSRAPALCRSARVRSDSLKPLEPDLTEVRRACQPSHCRAEARSLVSRSCPGDPAEAELRAHRSVLTCESCSPSRPKSVECAGPRSVSHTRRRSFPCAAAEPKPDCRALPTEVSRAERNWNPSDHRDRALTVSRACLSLDAPLLARVLSRRSGSSCVPVPVEACASPEGAALPLTCSACCLGFPRLPAEET
jgi:hypothetical protein